MTFSVDSGGFLIMYDLAAKNKCTPSFTKEGVHLFFMFSRRRVGQKMPIEEVDHV